MSHFAFLNFVHFLLIFVLLKVTYLVTLFDRKLGRFWHFNELLPTQNVNVARFARNAEKKVNVYEL